MAVIVEGISVIIKISSITSKYPGGWKRFKESLPNDTLCADSEIVRIGLMTPEDVKSFVEEMERHDLIYLHEGKAEDLVVIDQTKGPMVECNWIEFGKIDWQNDPQKKVSVCHIVGSKIDQILTPEGWDYDKSLSKNFGFASTENRYERLAFFEHKNGCDIYIDLTTGKKVYTGRTRSEN